MKAMFSAFVAALKKSLAGVDPQWEFTYKKRFFSKDSRFHFESTVKLDASVDLPGDTDDVAATATDLVGWGNSSGDGSQSSNSNG